MPREPGRPLSLTQELVDSVQKFSQIGMTWADLASFIGVSVSTIKSWRRKGEAEVERRTGGGEPDENLDLYVSFLSATKKARLSSKYACLAQIYSIGMNAEKPNWTALAWLLERQYPGEFALPAREKMVAMQDVIKQLQAAKKALKKE